MGAEPLRFRSCLRMSAPVAVTALLLGSQPLPAQQACVAAQVSGAVTLGDVLSVAEQCAPALRSARAIADGARAAVTSAGALPNPDFEILPSRFEPRPGASPLGGPGTSMGFTQRLENPAVRRARVAGARAGVDVAAADVRAVGLQVLATVRVRFFDLQRREQEAAAAREDRDLVVQIRDRVQIAVQQGESPRFDLLRAENEVVIATRQVERTRLLVEEGRALLRQVVGPVLAPDFAVTGDYFTRGAEPDSAAIHEAVRGRNPEVARADAGRRAAERQLSLEKGLRWPLLGLRAMNEQEPEQRIVRLGATIALPLWDRRRGPVREAEALVVRRTAELEQVRFQQERAFEVAWQQYRAALQGVALLEGAALDDARAAVRIAEVAYRSGERSILELLDARRQLRIVRSELIAAQFDLHAARAELERLASTSPLAPPSDAR